MISLRSFYERISGNPQGQVAPVPLIEDEDSQRLRIARTYLRAQPAAVRFQQSRRAVRTTPR